MRPRAHIALHLCRGAVLGLLLGPLLGAGVACRTAAPPPPPDSTPTSMSDHPFNLAPDDYWSDPWKTLEDLSWEVVADKRAGILLDVPAHVGVAERETLPALVYYSDYDDRLAAAPFRGRAVVVAVNLRSNTVRAALTLPPSPGAAAPKAAPSNGAAGALRGFSGMEFNVDLYKAGVVRRDEPGPHLVTVLLQDRASNRVRMQLGDRPANYDDPEVRRYLEAEWAKRPPRTVSPASLDDPQVRYVDLDDPLELPEDVGLRLDADRVVVGRDGARARLRVSYRLPVERADVLADEVRLTGAETDGREARVSPPVRAVVPITIVALGSERTTPLVWSLHAPSFAEVAVRGDAHIATGQFEVDLFREEAVRAKPQTFFLYAFAGEAMAGPVLMGVVDERQLPPRN